VLITIVKHLIFVGRRLIRIRRRQIGIGLRLMQISCSLIGVLLRPRLPVTVCLAAHDGENLRITTSALASVRHHCRPGDAEQPSPSVAINLAAAGFRHSGESAAEMSATPDDSASGVVGVVCMSRPSRARIARRA
jgi:hypothetical protein